MRQTFYGPILHFKKRSRSGRRLHRLERTCFRKFIIFSEVDFAFAGPIKIDLEREFALTSTKIIFIEMYEEYYRK